VTRPHYTLIKREQPYGFDDPYHFAVELDAFELGQVVGKTPHGDLAGILTAAQAGDGMSAGIRTKLLSALPYLAVAPKVVAVVRDLDLTDADTLLRPLDDGAKRDAAALAEQWALGTAMTRIIDALDAV